VGDIIGNREFHCRQFIESWYYDLNNQSDMLFKLTNSYRLLIGGADDFNKIALSKKKDVKNALNRAVELGEIIDEVIKSIDRSKCVILNYNVLKAEALEKILGTIVAEEVAHIIEKNGVIKEL